MLPLTLEVHVNLVHLTGFEPVRPKARGFKSRSSAVPSQVDFKLVVGVGVEPTAATL